MSKRKVSNYDRATIIEYYDRGLYSQRELADMFSVSRATVRRVIEDDRNFCGRAERPTFGTVDRSTYDHTVTSAEVGRPMDGIWEEWASEQTGPPKWLGWGLMAVAVSGAGFIGWVILNAL